MLAQIFPEALAMVQSQTRLLSGILFSCLGFWPPIILQLSPKKSVRFLPGLTQQPSKRPHIMMLVGLQPSQNRGLGHQDLLMVVLGCSGKGLVLS